MDWRTSISEIPRGNAGNVRTLRAMSALAQAGSKHPLVIQAAQDAVRGTPERTPPADFAAILRDVRRRMRYTHDPLDAEVVKAPEYVIQRTNLSPHPEPMDCDDATTLAGAMLGAIGYRTSFVTVATDRSRPDEWSHVYLAAYNPEAARWVPMDPIVREFEVGEEVPEARLTAPRAYHEGVDPMMRGIGCERTTTGVGSMPAGLGYVGRGMGADDTPWYGQLLNTVGTVFTSKAQSAQAKSAADIANANARLAAISVRANRQAGMSPSGFFKNPDGTVNYVNVGIAAVGVGVIGYALMKMGKRR